MGKTNSKGRSNYERHIQIPMTVLDSPAWRSLSGSASKLLNVLIRHFDGHNNGNIYLSARRAALYTGLTRNTVMRAARELQDRGLTKATKLGHFCVKDGPATTWRLTFRPAYGQAPTNEWQLWKPSGKKIRAGNMTEAGAETAHVSECGSKGGSTNEPLLTETPEVSVSAAGSNLVPQLVYQDGGASGPLLLRPETGAGGPQAKSDTQLLALRERMIRYLELSDPGTQTRVASAAGIPKGTLSKFKNGLGLASPHRLALVRELDRLERSASSQMLPSHGSRFSDSRLALVVAR